MTKGLPWFKVQTRLVDNPKFQSLTIYDRGCLLCLWCIAYAAAPRGRLPDIKIIARSLSQSYVVNTRRVSSMITRLVHAGFLERHDDGSIWIHDAEFWQAQRALNSTVSSTVSSTVLQRSVEKNVDNKQDNLDFDVPRRNRGLDSGASHHKHSMFVENGKDMRYKALVEHITCEWLEWRGQSVTSAFSKSDWSSLAALLKRTRHDEAYSINALKSAFTRFAASKRPFDRRQTLRYWCSKCSVFISQDKQSQQDTPRGSYIPRDNKNTWTMAELEWWKK